ncbi:hypothetical protein FIBSPDRAFT_443298 [Athelia psychrophila]|uniref:G domain-containing protein n=1 Tax=Athelia psychrophila TaxID=1759441 RepID=A0A167UFZ1_9AGAM|nr:hypothetical protein FIBSPDRAFT_443298 [Fibularhizoctonia sp. CBS 109695]
MEAIAPPPEMFGNLFTQSDKNAGKSGGQTGGVGTIVAPKNEQQPSSPSDDRIDSSAAQEPGSHDFPLVESRESDRQRSQAQATDNNLQPEGVDVASYIPNHSASYEDGTKLAGMIYMHRITAKRHKSGPARHSFSKFRELYGDDSLKNVAIVTNFWSEVAHTVGVKREKQLREVEFKADLDLHAKLLRHYNKSDTAAKIIGAIMSDHPIALRDVKTPDKDVVIAVMGGTGTGKSTFINLISGSKLRVSADLKSCTDTMSATAPFDFQGQKVVLLDTPGFDDSERSDIDILMMITTFLTT